MLPKKYRLPPKLIPLVARKGKRYSNEWLGIKYLAQNSAELPRFAIIVSKKVDNRAVIRNQIKRRLRPILVQKAQAGQFPFGDYLVMVNSVGILEVEELNPIFPKIN